jgi:hypothetical protein
MFECRLNIRRKLHLGYLKWTDNIQGTDFKRSLSRQLLEGTRNIRIDIFWKSSAFHIHRVSGLFQSKVVQQQTAVYE